MKEFYGIDVSSNNGTLDFNKISGVSFCIMRITQKYGIDSQFEANYDKCVKKGLKTGVYRFSYALNAEDSKKEAEDVVRVLNGRHLDFPVFLDLEWEKQMKLSTKKMDAIINAFRDVIITSGYKFGIYTGDYFYKNLISSEIKSKCQDFWIAAYPNNDKGEIVERLRPSYGVGWQYSSKKRFPGINCDFDADVFYKDYSESTPAPSQKEEKKMAKITANDAIKQMQSWLGRNEYDGSHKPIIDIYNAHSPLARGYKVKYTDQWCDTCISACFIALNAVDAIGGTECGVEEHVKLFQKAGIWIEDGTITPMSGDIIVFNWDDSTQPNDGYSDHIGIVETVKSGTITTIEGNYHDAVARRQIPVGYGNVRGYARPKYSAATESKPVETKPASEKTTAPSKTRSTIRRGSKGEDVRTLQTMLNTLGSNLVVDGDFGYKTYAAFTYFQHKNGLKVDGVCGPLSWAKLNEKTKAQNSPGSENQGTSLEAVARDVIAGKYGNTPDRKKNLEKAGYNYEEVQKIVNSLLKK